MTLLLRHGSQINQVTILTTLQTLCDQKVNLWKKYVSEQKVKEIINIKYCSSASVCSYYSMRIVDLETKFFYWSSINTWDIHIISKLHTDNFFYLSKTHTALQIFITFARRLAVLLKAGRAQVWVRIRNVFLS